MRRWQAAPGAQTRFLSSSAYEVLFGGAAGGGKSVALLMAALRGTKDAAYRALLLRRTFPELQRSLIEVSRQIYPLVGGVYNESRKTWTFPSGAKIEFGHLESEHDVHQYQSAEYSFIGFDELTSFTRGMYVYMLSRLRSSTGLPIQVRAATNPGGKDGHDWVMESWRPWLDPTAPLIAEPSQTLHYRIVDDTEQWCEKGPGTLSRQFIPARAIDNPYLMEHDPEYITRLGALDPVTRAQLRDGNWLIKPGAGMYFKASWFGVVEHGPGEAKRVRYWDRAASENGDWTVGLRLAHTVDGTFTVEDVVRFRARPAEVEARIKATAAADGKGVMVGIEQDPGQAGVFEADYYVKQLVGYNVRTFRPTGDKVTRALPASAQAEHSNIKIVRGAWNQPFLEELEGFPEASHDDQVDALSGAFNSIASAAPVASFTNAQTQQVARFRSARRTFDGAMGDDRRGYLDEERDSGVKVLWSAPSIKDDYTPRGGNGGGWGNSGF
jgi:predicted phage terminase large subunit-like protein